MGRGFAAWRPCSRIGRWGNFFTRSASVYRDVHAGALPVSPTISLALASLVANLANSTAVFCFLEKALTARFRPPSELEPVPVKPGSGATPNLPRTLLAGSGLLARPYTYGQLRRNISLPDMKAVRLSSSWKVMAGFGM